MNDPDPTLPMAHPPISSSSDMRPRDTLLQRGAFDPPATPGTLGRLDRFEILRLIGEGGMGQVYLAREPLTDTQVAVKIMKPDAADDPREVHRFLTEARHMYRLSHPRILRVLEVSDRPAGPYYVMPFIAGGSLLGRCKPEDPMPESEVLAIARQVAEALAHAHAHGLIHRDLKPGNVLLDKEGNAYLTDFGLVRTFFNDSMVDATASHLEGTAPYMSPAVARGEAEDTRCDIYAFGALLYELLTGTPPYTGRTPQIILDQVLKGPPVPLREVNPKASPALVKIAEGCMALELHARYTTMTDVVSDLALAAKGATPLGPHQQEQRRRLPRLAALLAGTLAVAGVAGVAMRHFSRQSPPRPEVAGHLGGAGSPSTLPVTGGLQAPPSSETRFVRPQTPGLRRPASGVLAQTSVLAATSPSNFTYTANNGAITITKYTGPGGAVVIPEKIDGLPVTCIGWQAFAYRPDITHVTIPDSVTHIGVSAFFWCYNLTSVTLPSRLVELHVEAFSYCGFSSITLPASVTSMNVNPFNHCASLTAVAVDAANPSFSSSADGIVFSKDKRSLVCYPAGKAGSYVIPNSVTKIGASAFSGCANLTGITIPNSVTNIGPWAFSCERLKDIVIPDSVVSIEDGAFQNSPSLTRVTIPRNVTSIGKLFHNCRGLSAIVVDAANTNYCSVDGVLFDKAKKRLISYPGGRAGSYQAPEDVKEIDPEAFNGCAILPSATLPASVTRVGQNAFANCADLTGVYFKGDAPSGGSDSSVFGGSDKVTVYYRPGTKGWGKTFGGRPTAVWEEAGTDEPTAASDGLTRLTDGLVAYFPLDGNMIDASGNGHDGKAHGAIRFVETANGKALDLDGYSWVMLPDDRLLDGSSNATIALWFNTRNVRELCTAFGTGDKRSGQDPISVQLDCANRIMSCGLSDLTAQPTIHTSSRVPLGALSTNEWHFFAMTFAVTRGQTQLRVFIDGTMAEDQIANTRVPIRYDTSMRTSIGASGDAGMAWVGGLDEVRIYSRPLSSDEIKTLFAMRQPANLSAIAPISFPYTYTTNNGAITITKYTGPGGVVTIPATVNGLPVRVIGGVAFADCNVTDIRIPESVSRIEAYAFRGCKELTDIVIPQGVTYVDGLAFTDCVRLDAIKVDAINPAYGCDESGVLFNKDKTELVICPMGKTGVYVISNGVLAIGDWAFAGGKLTAVTIPASVSRINGGGVFGGENSLKRIAVDPANTAFTSGEDGVLYNKQKTVLIRCPQKKNGKYEIPTGVLRIEPLAFSGCQGLASVTLPCDTTSIGVQAFIGCSNLTAITIPNNVTNLGGHTFAYCSALTSATVGYSVTNIGGWAFYRCGNLESVRFLGDAPALGQGVFLDANKAIIYYLPGTKGWGKEFGGRPTEVWKEEQ